MLNAAEAERGMMTRMTNANLSAGLDSKKLLEEIRTS